MGDQKRSNTARARHVSRKMLKRPPQADSKDQNMPCDYWSTWSAWSQLQRLGEVAAFSNTGFSTKKKITKKQENMVFPFYFLPRNETHSWKNTELDMLKKDLKTPVLNMLKEIKGNMDKRLKGIRKNENINKGKILKRTKHSGAEKYNWIENFTIGVKQQAWIGRRLNQQT